MIPDALIFNIQKFSLHDGPGIRTTVFFKGCPLSCRWCHNMESQNPNPEAMLRLDNCTGCASCVSSCPQEAISIEGDRSSTQRSLCTTCSSCLISCPQNLRTVCGESMNLQVLLEEVLKDRVFYERSGGGVTCSGGEAMSHIDFLQPFLNACKAEGLHTAVDCSGQVPWEAFERILPVTDLFLYDLKAMDEEVHRLYTGVGNSLILENLRRLSDRTKNIWIRLPLIPGVNLNEEHIEAAIDFLRPLGLKRVHLLPFHPLGRSKAPQLGLSFAMGETPAPDPHQIQTIKTRLIASGFEAHIGG